MAERTTHFPESHSARRRPNFARRAAALAAGLLLGASPSLAQSGFDVIWDDFNSGGGFSAGPRFDLNGTFGQGDAVVMSSARFRMTGGFHNPLSMEPCVGDLDGDRDTDLQDLAFLLANFAQSGVGYAGGDVDADGDVDLQDLAYVLSNFGVTCSR